MYFGSMAPSLANNTVNFLYPKFICYLTVTSVAKVDERRINISETPRDIN